MAIILLKWQQPFPLRAVQYPEKRLVLAFQPHRYTRTRDLFEDFTKVLNTVDALVLTEVYAAGEEPIAAADSRALARAIRVLGKLEPIYCENVADLPQMLLNVLQDGDVVLNMGCRQHQPRSVCIGGIVETIIINRHICL